MRLIFILPINTYLILQKDQFKVNKDNVTSKQKHWKEDKAFTRCNSFEKQFKLSSVIILYQFPGIMVIPIQNYYALFSKWGNQHSSILSTSTGPRRTETRTTSYVDRQAARKHQAWGSCTFSLATKGVSQVTTPGTPCCSSVFLLCCPSARITWLFTGLYCKLD